tara:strand:+ start:2897 stop:3271 length:375 start_codon:yes stop_codon:yes gene_type:complete
MTRKRARTPSGHYQADDPSTPDVDEAFEQEATTEKEAAPKLQPGKKARQKNAPKNENPSLYSLFVSAEPENGAFDLRVNDDIRVSGRWDAERSYVHWRVPREFVEMAKLHHHVWSGRIISCEEE